MIHVNVPVQLEIKAAAKASVVKYVFKISETFFLPSRFQSFEEIKYDRSSLIEFQVSCDIVFDGHFFLLVNLYLELYSILHLSFYFFSPSRKNNIL